METITNVNLQIEAENILKSVENHSGNGSPFQKPKDLKEKQIEKERTPRREQQQHGRQQRNRTKCSQSSPSLADFAPDLLNLGQEQDTKHSGRGQNRNRNRRRTAGDDFWSLRSPLHRDSSGRQDFTPQKGMMGPGVQGSNRSGVSGQRRQPRTRSKLDGVPSSSHLPGDGRRIRKCLWAGEEEEEDEAFVEDDFTEESNEACKSPKVLTQLQVERRQKDIDYGKATKGYQNYLEAVPKDQRNKTCPCTPEKNSQLSRRKWDTLVKQWRIALHSWDAPCEMSLKPPGLTTTKVQSEPSDGSPQSPQRELSFSPSSMVISSPSDLGYVTTPDSCRADVSLNEDNDSDDSQDMEFPPLPSSGRKWWWQEVEEEDVDDSLDECVEKLKIGKQHKEGFEKDDSGDIAEELSSAAV